MTRYGELCASERDVLCALSDGVMLSGQDVKARVQPRRDINNQSLYGALDKLDDKGLVERHAEYFDRRTNGYVITDAGIGAIRDRREWVMNCDAYTADN